MTFSEKLRTARKNAGLSQEQLAEKLCVSRQAVTKWETAKGLPDIENIKAISSLLNVSIDYLLSDEADNISEMKEEIDLSRYHKGDGARSPQDACAADKFPNAEHIWSLIRRRKLSVKEWIADLIIAPGTADVMSSVSDDGCYYLVEGSDGQFFVRVDKEFITYAKLASSYSEKSFHRGKYVYKKLYDIKK